MEEATEIKAADKCTVEVAKKEEEGPAALEQGETKTEEELVKKEEEPPACVEDEGTESEEELVKQEEKAVETEEESALASDVLKETEEEPLSVSSQVKPQAEKPMEVSSQVESKTVFLFCFWNLRVTIVAGYKEWKFDCDFSLAHTFRFFGPSTLCYIRFSTCLQAHFITHSQLKRSQ